MTWSIAAVAALLLLPGILILRGPLWLALPASLSVWLASWMLTAALGGRDGLVSVMVTSGLGLAVVGLPRLGGGRLLLVGTTLAVLTVGAVLGTHLGLPFSEAVAEEAAAAHLLAWHDGPPHTRTPFGEAAFRWPGGLAPLLADARLLGAAMGPAVWTVAAGVLLAFVSAAALPRDGERLRAVRLVAVLVAGLVGVVLHPGLLLALTLALAARRLKVEKPGGASTFGAVVLVAGALVAGAPLPWRGLPSGWGRGPTAEEARTLASVDREVPRLVRVCAEREALGPWIPALAAHATGPGCTVRVGRTSFHTEPPNQPRGTP